MIVDSHHHFWDPSRREYPWMGDELAEIRRRFGPDDLRPLLEANGVDRTILVQTVSSLDETREFLEIALPAAVDTVRRHPEMRFVIDHAAKPRIAGGLMDLGWEEAMAPLADLPNVACKISGLVTEADWKRWTDEDLEPYVRRVLGWFGSERCMFGSDWPVCLLAASYERVVATMHALVGDDESVFGGTAARVYGIR